MFRFECFEKVPAASSGVLSAVSAQIPGNYHKMAVVGSELLPEELNDPAWWKEEVVPQLMQPVEVFPFVIEKGGASMWITSVRTMNCFVVEDAFVWSPSMFAMVLRREQEIEEGPFAGPVQVQIHIVFSIEQAMDILAKYLFLEDYTHSLGQFIE